MVLNLPATIRSLFRKHPLVAESALVASAILVGKLASLIWKIGTAHQGTQVVGEIEYILTTTNLIAALAIQGLPMAVTIWTARLHHEKQSDRHLISESLVFGLFTASILSLVALAAFNLFPSLTGQMQTPPITYLWVIPGIVAIELLSAWFNGRKLYHWYALGKYLGQPLLRVGLFFGLILCSVQQATVIHLHLTAAVALLLIGLGLHALQVLRADITLQSTQTSDWSKLKHKFWGQGAVLSGSLLLYVIYTASDVYWLNHYFAPSVVGTFSLLLALASLLELVFYPILNLLQTRLGIFQSQSQKSFAFLSKNIGISAVIGIATAIGLMLVKPYVVLLFGSSSQAISSQLLGLILVWKLIANTIVLPIRHYLDYFGWQKTTLLTMSGSFLLKGLLSWMLIPSQGILGVIIANIAAELLHALWLLYCLRSHYLRNCG